MQPEDAHDLATWRDALGRVLAGRDLDIVTQPIVDLRVETVVGYEALTRFPGWPSADPGAWFAVAHEFGVGPELVAVTVGRQLGLVEHLPGGCFLAVKVSRRVLDAATVQPVLDRARLDAVVVELDEPGRAPLGSDQRDRSDLVGLADRLRSRGAWIAVTCDGRAEVPELGERGPDIVRIGRPLIAGIDADVHRRRRIARLQMRLADTGTRLLASAIETRPELDALVDVGVPLGQGFVIGRPAPGWGRPDPRHGLACTDPLFT